jgi:hypothetical protein
VFCGAGLDRLWVQVVGVLVDEEEDVLVTLVGGHRETAGGVRSVLARQL